MERLCSLLGKLHVPKQQLFFSIYPKIPLEIVLQIFDHLTLLDQICLSLCCKYLYEAFLYSVKAKNTQMSQLCPRQTRPILCLKKYVEERPRVKLLRRLEDNQWKFCDECWFLHPRPDRRAWCLSGNRTSKIHNLISFRKEQESEEDFFAQDDDIKHRGMVEICPCLTITFEDKLNLIERIRKLGGDIVPYDDEVYPVKLASQWQNKSSQGRLLHDCAFTHHPFARVNVATQVWQEGPFLLARSDYEFQMEDRSSRDMPTGLKTPFIFPEESVKKWMRTFFDEAGSKFSGWPNDRNLTSLKEGWPRKFEIRVTRNLGDESWPNPDWSRHCCS